ncbi:DUF4129 domain-containing protein [Arenimonas sp.]|uniref:DUF4129 domain-containing protein n=1 Tax=Arenimonas sp. TaxID=1872635 RepID=UPI0039E685FE
MRLDRLSIVLRPRTPWEAMDLGQALAREHAGAAWKSWIALSLPFLIVFNALAWWADKPWLAGLAMWWFKPLFERAPLYVLSRAVFGQAPSLRETLRSKELWASSSLLAWLSWRRLHPARSMLMPVDLLEGLRGSRRSQRAAVLQRAVGAQAWGLMLACLSFELMLFIAMWVLVLMFEPIAHLDESARAMWTTFFQAPPEWAVVVGNGVAWLAMSLIGPFYAGAGFGLYLNRRTQLEAWDVELSFRRLAERLRALSVAAMFVLATWLAPWSAMPVLAAPTIPQADDCDKPCRPKDVFGEQLRASDPRQEAAAREVVDDPLLSPTQKNKHWVLKNPPKPDKKSDTRLPSWSLGLGALFGAIGEYGLWILAGILLALLLWQLPRWLPWVRDRLPQTTEPDPIVEHAVLSPEKLPDDVVTVARELWSRQRHRDALALLYRAGVAAIERAHGSPLPPGATEADCLRRARRLPDGALRECFAQVVRLWQGAAYARRVPDDEAFAALLQRWLQTPELVR